MLASEALHGFVGWLTSRNERITMSSRDEAGTDAVAEFCRVNQLAEPRENWAENLVFPEEQDEKDTV